MGLEGHAESSTSIWGPVLLGTCRLLRRSVHVLVPVVPNLVEILHHVVNHMTHESASDGQACLLRVVESNAFPRAYAAVAFAGTAHACDGTTNKALSI